MFGAGQPLSSPAFRALAACATAALLSGCAGYETFIRDVSDMPVTNGTVKEWNDKGSWEYRVDHCTSGGREGFYGITLHSDDGQHSVRLVRNPVGPMTVAIDTVGRDAWFVPVTCRAVDASIRPTGWATNHVPVLTGEVRFACDGLRGAAVFTCG
jgi:hypothetical protein